MSRPAGLGQTIMLVDDSTLVAEVVSDFLRDRGFHVVNAHSAESALAMLAELTQRPAVVVADYKLGHGMRGSELLTKAMEAYPGMRGILTSGAFDAPPVNVPFAVLGKPFKREALLELIMSVMALPASEL